MSSFREQEMEYSLPLFPRGERQSCFHSVPQGTETALSTVHADSLVVPRLIISRLISTAHPGVSLGQDGAGTAWGNLSP